MRTRGEGTGNRKRVRARPARGSREETRRRIRRSVPASRFRTHSLRQAAQGRLRRFRQGSAIAVALTGMILLMFGGAPESAQAQTNEPVAEAAANREPEQAATVPVEQADPAASIEQATGTIRDLFNTALTLLPKVLIGLVLILVAWLITRVVGALLRKALGKWERTDAIVALSRIAILIVGIAAAMTVMAGDVRALLGSIGLVGLALSWALQTPIESFTGWLLNSFRGYYRVGDRIEVGEVFGDVYKIDVLTTTVWEAGGPGKAVAGAQATGAMITFPNWEVLRSNIVNYSREFPYVWDEVTVGVANESDLPLTVQVLKTVARRVVGDLMEEPAAAYRQLLKRARLNFDVEEEPAVFMTPTDSWTNFTIRYLVPARARRRWATNLHLAIAAELGKPEYSARIKTSYPRSEVILKNPIPEGKEAR